MPSPAVYDGPDGLDFDHATLTLAAACQAERLRRAAAQLANWIVQRREAEKLGFPDPYSVQVVEGAALLVAVTCFHDIHFGPMAGWPESAGVASATAFKLATGLVDAFNLYMSDGVTATSARTRELASEYATAENVRACLHIAELCPSIFDGPNGGERFEQATAAWETVHARRIDSTTRRPSAHDQLEAVFALIPPESSRPFDAGAATSTHGNTREATAPGSDPAEPQSGETTGPTSKKSRRGGKRLYDRRITKRVDDAWKTGRYATYTEMAAALRDTLAVEPGETLTGEYIKAALDRARKQ